MTPTAPLRSLRARAASLTLLSIALAATLAALAVGCSGSSGGGGLFGGDEVPYADMMSTLGTTSAVTIRGRLVNEDKGFDPKPTDPFDAISQDELKGAQVTLALVGGGATIPLGSAQADDEGYIRATFPLQGASPGDYTIQVTYQGAVAAGVGRARLLPDGYDGVLVRSDIDLTYLNTNFTSKAGLLELMELSASERDALPAMEVVYQALREGADGAHDHPLAFVSGSPTFFKRVLESKASLDGVREEGIHLKNYTDIVITNLSDWDFAGVVPDLKEQVGYKLAVFLELRLETPPTIPELYLGDDSEADFVVYNLYHRFTSGELSTDALLAEADTLGMTAEWRAIVADLAPRVATHMAGAPAPVQAIYINRTGKKSESFEVADWLIPGMSRHHTGAWPLILDLYEGGFVGDAAVTATRDRLKALGQTDAQLSAAAQDGVNDGFLDPATLAIFP